METVLKFMGPFILNQMTPAVKSLLETFLKQWQESAKATPNPWDNMAVSFLAGIFGVELEG